MRKLILISSILVLIAGCIRTTLVPPGQAIQLREPVENHPVWVEIAENFKVPGKADIPEGWWCLPYEEEEEQNNY